MTTRARASAPVALLATLVATLAAACRSMGTPHADDAGLDAAGESCVGERWLEIGRCVRSTGEPCLSGPGEERHFEPLPDGATVPITIGHQGSRMIALAARARGIAPGDPAHPSDTGNPSVVLTLRDAEGHDLALYRGRAAFEPDPGEPGRFVCRDLPLIVDGVPVAGSVRLDAHLRDADGVERCGALRLVVAP